MKLNRILKIHKNDSLTMVSLLRAIDYYLTVAKGLAFVKRNKSK